MKKRFIVRSTFINEFEADSDVQALIDAAYAIKYGQETVRHLELKVVNCQTLPPVEAEAPAPVEDKQDSMPQAPSTDFPL